MYIDILNIKNINTSKMDVLVRFCDQRIREKKGAFLIPMNPIKVIKASRFPDFQSIIDRADWVFPDAWGIKWAASLIHGKNISLLPGYRVMFELLGDAAKNGRRVFFLGTRAEILGVAVEKIKKMYPGIRIVGTHHGFFTGDEEEDVFRIVSEKKPDFVFVAMGEYKQEKVISRLRPFHPSAVYMGVGGSIDLIAGEQPEPPEWIRAHHLEWIFRLVKQPFRAPRFAALPHFAAQVIISKVCGANKSTKR